MSSSEWKTVKVGDTIISSNTGLDAIKRAPIVDFDSGIKCLRIQDISQDKNFADWGYCQVEEKNYKKFQLVSGDIIVARTGATIGVNKLIKKELKAVYNNGLIRIKTNPNIITSEYLFYNLQSDKYKGHILAISGGTSTQPNMKMNALLDYEIKLPILEEQKSIAATLSCLDDKIELNNRMNKNLEEMAQAIFKSWFVDFEPFQDGEFEESELGMIPKGWVVVELGDIGTFVKGKKPEVLDMKPCDTSSSPYLTIDVLNGGLPQYANSEKMVLAEKFDILMVMDGASSGTVYYGLTGIVASTLAKYKVDKNDLLEIVYQYLNFYQDDIKSHNTGSAIPHTDKGFVSKIKMLIPDEQSKLSITEIFNRIRLSVLENKLQSQKLIEIRDTLLPKLMSGEIRVPIEEVQ